MKRTQASLQVRCSVRNRWRSTKVGLGLKGLKELTLLECTFFQGPTERLL